MLPTPRCRSRGFTVIEAMVTSSILLLLFGAIVMIYASSAKVWRKVDNRTALLRELQVAMRYLERDLEMTHPFGLTYTDNRIAYLSVTDDDNEISFDNFGRPEWRRFILVYLSGDDQRLVRRHLSLGGPRSDPPTFYEFMGVPLSTFNVELATLDRQLTHTGRVTHFSLEPEVGPVGNYGSLYELTVKGEQTLDEDQVDRVEIRTKVSVRR